MQEQPEKGLEGAAPYAFPVVGRVRPDELLRRKLIRKMVARRERRLALAERSGRRFG
jgi:hypothetical protein